MNNQNKSNKGGARAGAGRKSVHDELAARDLAVKAIISTFGGLEQGMMELLKTGEPSLVKFVWEHALGKPTDKVQHSGEMGINWLETKTYESDKKANKGS